MADNGEKGMMQGSSTFDQIVDISDEAFESEQRKVVEEDNDGLLRGKERQMIIFSLNDEEFASDITQIKEIQNFTEITSIPEADKNVEGVINLRNKIIVISNICKKMGMAMKSRTTASKLVVLEYDHGSIGLIVNSVYEVKKFYDYQIQKPSKALSDRINTRHMEGVIIDNKRVIIVLNLLGLFEKSSMMMANVAKKLDPKDIVAKIVDKPVKAPVADEAFLFPDGSKVTTLEGMKIKLYDIDEATFNTFISEENHHIADWIRHSIKDEKMADDVNRVKVRDDLIALLSKGNT